LLLKRLVPNPPPKQGPSREQGGKKKRGGAGCLVLIVLLVLALVWRCIPDSHAVWQGTVPSTPPTSTVTPPLPTDLPRPLQVPTYDMGYLRWAGTLQPGQFATWGSIGLSTNTEIPVGGVVDAQPPCQVYGKVKVLTGQAVTFIIFNEANYRSWREGKKATARAMQSVSSEQDYGLAMAVEKQYLVLDNRKGTGEVMVGLTGIQSCLRPVQPGETLFQAQPRPTATWVLREEKLTLFSYLLRLVGADGETQVMTPPEIH
jgi:hypothetical protein